MDRTRFSLALLGALALASTGCSLTLPNVTTGGTVKAAGQPVQAGQSNQPIQQGQPGQQGQFGQQGQMPQGEPGQQANPCLPTRQVAAFTPVTQTIGDDVPAVYRKLYGAYALSIEGDYVVIKSMGEPDHASPYYTGENYAAETNPAFRGNPSTISGRDVTYKIPLHPVEDPSHAETPLGQMGVALDGVPFYNQYAAGRSTLGNEILGFDSGGGHPDQDNQYHYHVEPTFLTGKFGKDALLGFLLDGFPVYGPQENGKTVASADLDQYHGHFTVTADYPQGIYHYHTTADSPYIAGVGYYGKSGQVIDTGRGGGMAQGGTTGGQQQQMPGGQQQMPGGQQQMPGGQQQGQMPQQQGGQQGPCGQQGQMPQQQGQMPRQQGQMPGGQQQGQMPGGQQTGGQMPPPPGGTQTGGQQTGGQMPPPPGGTQTGGQMPPPPGGTQTGGQLPPPPTGTQTGGQLPPPPTGTQTGSQLPPPPGGQLPPPPTGTR
jgi:hypothetical protein